MSETFSGAHVPVDIGDKMYMLQRGEIHVYYCKLIRIEPHVCSVTGSDEVGNIKSDYLANLGKTWFLDENAAAEKARKGYIR